MLRHLGRSVSCRSSQLSCAANKRSYHRTALVQGASRGLGLEFVRQLLEERPQYDRVVASCRNPDEAIQLSHLQSIHGKERLSIIPLDLNADDSIHQAADMVKNTLGISTLHLLLNVSGLLHSPGKLAPETSLAKITRESLEAVYTVNTFGPLLTLKAFQDLIVAGGGEGPEPAIVAGLSARVSSIEDNTLGGWYSYRSSKTALNQLMKCAAIEFSRKKQNVSCILLHPGTVDTELSRPFQRNVVPEKLFTKERAVRQLLDIIGGATLEQNGLFFAWDKQIIPW